MLWHNSRQADTNVSIKTICISCTHVISKNIIRISSLKKLSISLSWNHLPKEEERALSNSGWTIKRSFFMRFSKREFFFLVFFLVVHFIFILYSLAIHGYILIEKYPNRMTFNAKKHHVNDERWIVKCCQHKHSVSINKRKTICVVMAEGANKKETMNTNIIEVEPSMVVTTIWLRVHFGSVAHTLIYVLAETCSTVKKMCHVSLFFALFNRFGNKIDR